MIPEGYVWLYKGKENKHCNVTGRYEEFQKEGWSIYPDGRDLRPAVQEEAKPVKSTPLIPAVKVKRVYRRRKQGVKGADKQGVKGADKQGG